MHLGGCLLVLNVKFYFHQRYDRKRLLFSMLMWTNPLENVSYVIGNHLKNLLEVVKDISNSGKFATGRLNMLAAL
jgi:hypothetical protein